MCVKCELQFLLERKDGDDLFADLLLGHVIEFYGMLSMLEYQVKADINNNITILFCKPELYSKLLHRRLLFTDLNENSLKFTEFGLQDIKGKALDEEIFKGRDAVHHFHLMPYQDKDWLKDCPVESRSGKSFYEWLDENHYMESVNISRLMISYDTRSKSYCFNIIPLPYDNFDRIRLTAKTLREKHDEIRKFYRIVKDRVGVDAKLFLLCLIKDIESYFGRTRENILHITTVIEDIALSEMRGVNLMVIDELLRSYREDEGYAIERDAVKHSGHAHFEEKGYLEVTEMYS